MARALPGASGDAHGGEGRREGYVGSHKPLQEGAAHCGGGAIAGGGSTGMSINAKIQFEKTFALQLCVDCATGVRVDTVINRTDKTFSASKTALSHILWS